MPVNAPPRIPLETGPLRRRLTRPWDSTMVALVALLAWGVIGAGLLLLDLRAAAAWAVNGLVLGIALFLAWRWKSLGAAIFLSLMFIGHALGAALFFLQEDIYSANGWNAVGLYDFSLSGFFRAYLPLLTCCFAVPFLVVVLRRFASGFIAPPSSLPPRPLLRHLGRRSNADGILYFIVSGGAFTCLFMYANGVGISGYESRALPFKLSGALFYLRLYVIPLALFWAYPRTSRKQLATILVIAYAFVAAASAGSRGLLMINLIPLAAEFIGRRLWLRLAVLGLVVTSLYVVVSRIKSENIESLMSLRAAVVGGTGSVHSGELADVVAEVVRRLHGPQQVVLFSQSPELSVFELPRRFFFGGEPFDDVARRLYQLELPEDRAFGIGIGFSGWITAVGRQATWMAALFILALGGVLAAIDGLLVLGSQLARSDRVALTAAVFVALVVMNDGYFGRGVALLGLCFLASWWRLGMRTGRLIARAIPIVALCYAVFHT